jgi:hypothetical protein
MSAASDGESDDNFSAQIDEPTVTRNLDAEFWSAFDSGEEDTSGTNLATHSPVLTLSSGALGLREERVVAAASASATASPSFSASPASYAATQASYAPTSLALTPTRRQLSIRRRHQRDLLQECNSMPRPVAVGPHQQGQHKSYTNAVGLELKQCLQHPHILRESKASHPASVIG